MAWPEHARKKGAFKKGDPGGPGLPKLSPEQKAERKGLREHMKQYLEVGGGRKIINAFEQALELANVPDDAENVAPCRQVALRAAQDLTDRLIGKPKESVEISGLQEFHESLSLAIQIEARLKELDAIDIPHVDEDGE